MDACGKWDMGKAGWGLGGDWGFYGLGGGGKGRESGRLISERGGAAV